MTVLWHRPSTRQTSSYPSTIIWLLTADLEHHHGLRRRFTFQYIGLAAT